MQGPLAGHGVRRPHGPRRAGASLPPALEGECVVGDAYSDSYPRYITPVISLPLGEDGCHALPLSPAPASRYARYRQLITGLPSRSSGAPQPPGCGVDDPARAQAAGGEVVRAHAGAELQRVDFRPGQRRLGQPGVEHGDRFRGNRPLQELGVGGLHVGDQQPGSVGGAPAPGPVVNAIVSPAGPGSMLAACTASRSWSYCFHCLRS